MAKGQKRSNKEIRKPKQEKPKATAAAGGGTPLKVIEETGFPGKKKK